MENPAKQACEDLLALAKHTKIGLVVLAERYGLTHMQFFVLDTICSGGMTMGRIAERLHCDASNITGIIDRLVVMGLVDRRENQQDRRIKVLQLTDAGHQLFAEITAAMPEALGCTKMRHDERAALHQVVQRLV